MIKSTNQIILPRIIVVSLLSLAMLAAVSAAADAEKIHATYIRPILSDNFTGQSFEFHFSGDYILWRNVYAPEKKDGLPYGGLYLYSLKDNSTGLIEKGTAGKGIYWETMSDDAVVWYEYPGEIHVYNISSGEERTIPDRATIGANKTYTRDGITNVARWMPSADGDRIAFLQGHSPATYGDSDIVLLNLTANGMTPINETPSARGGLILKSNRIIWHSYLSTTDTRVYLADFTTGKETVIAPDPGLKVQTALSDTYAAWTDARDPTMYPAPLTQIAVYNISTGTTRKIPVTTMDQSFPVLAGDYVVYTECFTPTGKAAFKQTCDSKIFDILTGAVMEFPVSQNGRDMNSDYGYDRRIHAYSDGLFLIEDIRGDKRVFGLYRIENIRPVNTKATLKPVPSVPPAETTASLNVSVPQSPAQPATGAGAGVLVLAVLAVCGITRKKW